MTVTAELIFQGASGQMTANQPFNVTCILTNLNSSTVTVSSFAPFAENAATGLPSSSVNIGTPTTVGNVTAIQPGGQLVYSFGAVFMAPNGSPETGSMGAQGSTQGMTLGVTAQFSNGDSASASAVITPVQLGTTAPAAAGQFLFASPLNSPNILFW